MSFIPRIAEGLAEGRRGSLRTIEEADAAAETMRSSRESEAELGSGLSDKPKPSAAQFGPKLNPEASKILSIDEARAINKFISAINNVDKNIRGLTVKYPEGSIPMEGWWGTVKDQMHSGNWAEAADNIDGMLKLPGFQSGYSDAEFAKSLREVLAAIR